MSQESLVNDGTLAFTGHRPDKLGGYVPNPLSHWVRGQLTEAIVDRFHWGYRRFICGGGLGTDWWAAEAVLSLKEKHPGRWIDLILALPFKGYNAMWPTPKIEQFDKTILALASEVHYLSEPPYMPYKMQVRNKWMVDLAGEIAAVWDGSAGGTYNCLCYAMEQGRRIYRINPILKKTGYMTYAPLKESNS